MVYVIIVFVLAVILAAIGAVQLAGPPFVREAYRRWDYHQRVRIVTGGLDLLAALLLVVPALRGWGIGLAAVLTFGSVVVLIVHRHYLYAGLATVLMAALIPASLAVPRSSALELIGEGTLSKEHWAD